MDEDYITKYGKPFLRKWIYIISHLDAFTIAEMRPKYSVLVFIQYKALSDEFSKLSA